MRLLTIFALSLAGIFSQCAYAQEPLVDLKPGQLEFVKELEGKWVPTKFLQGGKEFKDKVALTAVIVSREGFEFVATQTKKKYQYTRVSEAEKKLDLINPADKKSRYAMKLDGETMWLCTKANDKYETELTSEPTKYNFCILLERPSKPK